MDRVYRLPTDANLLPWLRVRREKGRTLLPPSFNRSAPDLTLHLFRFNHGLRLEDRRGLCIQGFIHVGEDCSNNLAQEGDAFQTLADGLIAAGSQTRALSCGRFSPNWSTAFLNVANSLK